MTQEYYPPNKIYEEPASAADAYAYAPDAAPFYEEGEWADGQEWAYANESVYADVLPYYEQVDYTDGVTRSGVSPQLLIFPVVFMTVLLLIFLGQSITISESGTQVVAEETAVSSENIASIGGASSDFTAPYDEYVLTQGLHGYSYGHMAIDIAAGVGATIKAPIAGEITELYIDQYSNPTLVIENGRYKVTFLHGDYSVVLGQKLNQGDVIGSEGNNGYTMDSAGNLCYGRVGCGYHTHLNVFDKLLGRNVNPMNLIVE